MIQYCSLTSQEPSGQKKKQEISALVQTTVPQSMGLQDAGYFEHGEHAGKALGAGPLSAYPYFSCSSSLQSRPPKLVLLFPKAVIEIIVPTHKCELENLAFYFNPPLPSCTQSQQ